MYNQAVVGSCPGKVPSENPTSRAGTCLYVCLYVCVSTSMRVWAHISCVNQLVVSKEYAVVLIDALFDIFATIIVIRAC